MTKSLVLYCSTYGHVETLASAIAEGARSVAGVEVTVQRVPETMPPDVAKQHGAKLDQLAPVADPKELGVQPPSLVRTAPASPAPKNWPKPAFKVRTSLKSPPDYTTESRHKHKQQTEIH